MNITRLFEIQNVLRQRIGYDEPDRFNKLILAALVELGECANEQRGFKFWSKDQEPKTKQECSYCQGAGVHEFGYPFTADEVYPCDKCNGAGYLLDKNPLLEEYVDKLHFILELGIELGFTKFDIWIPEENSITDQFIEIAGVVYSIYQIKMRANEGIPIECYERLFGLFLGLGEMLGFTWEEIEKAYIDKNHENHERQKRGY